MVDFPPGRGSAFSGPEGPWIRVPQVQLTHSGSFHLVFLEACVPLSPLNSLYIIVCFLSDLSFLDRLSSSGDNTIEGPYWDTTLVVSPPSIPQASVIGHLVHMSRWAPFAGISTSFYHCVYGNFIYYRGMCRYSPVFIPNLSPSRPCSHFTAKLQFLSK